MSESDQAARLVAEGAVTLCDEPHRGRYLVASRDIAAGEVVLGGVPAYVTAVLPSHRKRVCAWCLADRRTRLTVRCRACNYTFYCSQECLEAHEDGATPQPPAPQQPRHHSTTTAATPVSSWHVAPVPHSMLCDVMQQFASFKFDTDMQAILLMCLEHLARQQLGDEDDGDDDSQHDTDNDSAVTDDGTDDEGGSDSGDGDARSQRIADISDEVSRGTSQCNDGSIQIGTHAADGEGSEATDQQQQEVSPNDFELLCTHMSQLPAKERQEWMRGARFLLTTMQKAGWPEPLPSEREIMDHCGRVLANSFGVFVSKHTQPHTVADSTHETQQHNTASDTLVESAAALRLEEPSDAQNTVLRPDTSGSEAALLDSGSQATVEAQQPAERQPDNRQSSGKDELTGRQVFISASFFNHSCDPNAEIAAGPRPCDPISIKALRAVHRGEEVSIAYMDVDKPRSWRQSYLKKYYCFTCMCARCEAERVHGADEKLSWSASVQSAGSAAAAAHAREVAAAQRAHGHSKKLGGHKGGGCSKGAKKKQQHDKSRRQQQ